MKNRRRGKDLQRFIARDTGGENMGIRGKEDVRIDNKFYAETKEREKLPVFLKKCVLQSESNCVQGKMPIVILHEFNSRHSQDLVIMRYVHFKQIALDKHNGLC